MHVQIRKQWARNADNHQVLRARAPGPKPKVSVCHGFERTLKVVPSLKPSQSATLYAKLKASGVFDWGTPLRHGMCLPAHVTVPSCMVVVNVVVVVGPWALILPELNIKNQVVCMCMYESMSL